MLTRNHYEQQLAVYTARIATDLLQVVDFTGLLQVCYEVAASRLTSSSCSKSVKIRLGAT